MNFVELLIVGFSITYQRQNARIGYEWEGSVQDAMSAIRKLYAEDLRQKYGGDR
jgi:hypothetical protein